MQRGWNWLCSVIEAPISHRIMQGLGMIRCPDWLRGLQGIFGWPLPPFMTGRMHYALR